MSRQLAFILLSLFLILSCRLPAPEDNGIPENNDPPPNELSVDRVVVSGNPGSYNFSVTLSSPDTGCDQYADWWEVFTPDSSLIYRRILAHSHVNEQPFSRSGGPLNIGEEDFVYVRGHMNNLGYSPKIMSGSVKDGFKVDELDVSYAKGLESIAPLPDDCAF